MKAFLPHTPMDICQSAQSKPKSLPNNTETGNIIPKVGRGTLSKMSLKVRLIFHLRSYAFGWQMIVHLCMPLQTNQYLDFPTICLHIQVDKKYKQHVIKTNASLSSPFNPQDALLRRLLVVPVRA